MPERLRFFVNDFFYVWCILCIICVGIECVVLNEKYGHRYSSLISMIRPSSSDLIVVEYIVTLFSRYVHLLNL